MFVLQEYFSMRTKKLDLIWLIPYFLFGDLQLGNKCSDLARAFLSRKGTILKAILIGTTGVNTFLAWVRTKSKLSYASQK